MVNKETEESRQLLTTNSPTLTVESLEAYQSLMIYYQSAIDEVETKLKIIDRELNNNEIIGRTNTIHTIQCRVKSFKSLVAKLEKRDVAFTAENASKELTDIAGIRVICAYVDDIYMVLKSLSQQADVAIIEVKDYIKDPKPSGYRSVHVILEVPVFFLKETKYIKVEVQFRTIAMDYWASLEHGLRYKHDVPDTTLTKRLEATATRISELEEEMLSIRKGIEGE